jgi:regulator of sigma D
MALFTKEDFNKMLIPVGEDGIEKLPLVKQIFGKITKSNVPQILYVAYMYDKNSPLRTKISSIEERKEEAAELAGISKQDRNTIFALEDKDLVAMVNAYLRYQSSKIWASMIANEEVLWQYQQELLTPITLFKNDKDKLSALEIKSKLMNECDAIIKRVEAYEDKLFGDLTDKKEEIINYTPESIANIG